ncbi:hypothetical protein BC829DRAFT_239505 [Chytridium lagenaria]|nr:hypothetical protein BC829DRAFT_239505 [Chytridium lagenaria]
MGANAIAATHVPRSSVSFPVPEDEYAFARMMGGRLMAGGGYFGRVNPDVVMPAFDWRGAVMKAVMGLAEEGDMQMCATAGLLLRGVVDFSDELMEVWCWEYVDLLHRFRLYVEANTIVLNSKVSSLEVRSLEMTTIYSSCGYCQKPIPNAPAKGWACESCKKIVSKCALCHKTVRGQYVWCQVCLHGGHLQCIRNWFMANVECCTGCRHQCLPTIIMPPSFE